MNHEMQILSGTVNGSSPGLIPLPPCRAGEMNIRPATLADLPFIDSLQKMHTKMVGWMPTKQLEGKIAAGQVLVAEQGRIQRAEGRIEKGSAPPASDSSLCPHPSALGYCIGHDQYFKRDDVGIIYQMNVLPGKQRGLIGASLLKAQFERSAYGCKLYCCWCAQDIAANYFWESMGFVPLAFRAGSRGKDRVQIFWQRRIRSGDETTPYWFPSQTSSGAIREDRLVLPIPPGVRWSDAMPRVLPQERAEGRGMRAEDENALPGQKRLAGPRARQPRPSVREPSYGLGGSKLRFGADPVAPVVKEKPPREKRKAVKNDPKLIAAARELRDRWLEEVNGGRYLPEARGRYDVGRSLPEPAGQPEFALPKVLPLMAA